MEWTSLPFIRSGPNQFARHTRSGKKTRQTEEKAGRQHQGIWTDLEFVKSQRAVENREKRKKLVVKLSVVPKRPRGEGIGEARQKQLSDVNEQ